MRVRSSAAASQPSKINAAAEATAAIKAILFYLCAIDN